MRADRQSAHLERPDITLLPVVFALCVAATSVAWTASATAQGGETTAERDVDASPPALEVGEEVGAWTVVERVVRPEFQRYVLEDSSGARTGVEITVGAIALGSGDGLFVQAAPGHRPPAELLDAVQGHLDGTVAVAPRSRAGRSRAGADRLRPFATVVFVALLLWVAVRVFGNARARWWDGRGGLRRTLEVSLAGAGAFAVVAWCVPESPLFHDPVTDLELARDCQHGYVCALGARTSLGAVRQGALWSRLLGWALGAGVPFAGMRHVLLALHSAGFAVIWSACRRETGSRSVALAIAMLWLAVLAPLIPLHFLWNPGLVPLGGALFAIAARRAAATGDTRDHLAAGLALMLLAEAHIIGLLVALVWCGAVGATARHPGRALAAVVGVIAAGHLAVSSGTVAENAAAVGDSGAAWWAIGLGVGLFAAGLAARRRQWDPVAVVGLTAAMFLFLVLAGAVVGLRALEVRYLTPVVGLLALFVAAFARVSDARPGHLLPGLSWLVLACVFLGVLAPMRHARDYRRTLSDIEPLGAALSTLVPAGSIGWAIHGTHARLDARIAGLMIPAGAAGGSARAVAIIDGIGQPPDTAGRWSTVDLHGEHFAFVRAYEPWVDRSPMVACAGADATEDCAAAERADSSSMPVAASAYFAERVGSAAGRVQMYEGAYGTYRYVVRPGPAGDTREVRLLTTDMGACRATITAVTGVAYSGGLPAEQVTLQGGGGPGTLEITVDRLPCAVLADFGPSWVELEAGDGVVRAMLDAATPTVGGSGPGTSVPGPPEHAPP